MRNIKQIAEVCHEANRAYCRSIGDYSQMTWAESTEGQKRSSIEGVKFAFTIVDEDNPSELQHNFWCKDKIKNGWVYGELKDAEKQTHPCLVEYNELPEDQKKKDQLFFGIVKILI